MRKLLSLAITAAFGLALAACGESPTTPQAALSADQGVMQKTVSLTPEVIFGDEDWDEGKQGNVTLRKKPNGDFSWQLKASGFEPGNAYTVWIGNFEPLRKDADGDPRNCAFLDIPGFDDVECNDAGWGSGGLVGGDGQVTASGNQCVWDLVTFVRGGFEPGKKPNCDRVDFDDAIRFIMLDHRDWEEGDILERWSPNGTQAGSDEVPTQVAGQMVGCFDFFVEDEGLQCPPGEGASADK